MKKDIKWLKEEVGELNLVDTVFEADGVSYIDTAVSVMQVYDLIDELDEQEVLSQEWVRNNQERKGVHFFVNVTKLQNLLVPKEELPVIPKYVADWITKYREKYDLYPALRLLENNTFVWGEIYEWYRMNTRKFVNAYLTGEYEVEEEPLYYALVKGHELVYDNAKYWVYDTWSQGDIFVGNRVQMLPRFKERLTMPDWNELGINDSNADFVKVDK